MYSASFLRCLGSFQWLYENRSTSGSTLSSTHKRFVRNVIGTAVRYRPWSERVPDTFTIGKRYILSHGTFHIKWFTVAHFISNSICCQGNYWIILCVSTFSDFSLEFTNISILQVTFRYAYKVTKFLVILIIQFFDVICNLAHETNWFCCQRFIEPLSEVEFPTMRHKLYPCNVQSRYPCKRYY